MINLRKYDYTLLFVVCLYIFFGLLMVFSSSFIIADIRWANPYKFFIKQILWVLIGLIAMLITIFIINYKVYQKFTKQIFIFTLFLVVAVLFVGKVHLGAKRWLEIWYITLQPSELAKIAVIISVADFISRKKILLNTYKGLIAPIILITVMIIPIILEPDLGTPLLILLVSIIMLFCAGIKIQSILIGIISALCFVCIEIINKPYRLLRVKNYLTSFANIDYASYQLKQSLNALGSGGLFGKGLGKSTMKLLYLPEAHSDFIFPIIGEELGLVGTLIVISFFLYLFIKGIKMSDRMPDMFSSYLCLGITLLIVFQALINFFVTTGILPTKGLPLPFISSGGTSLIINMIAIGILINLSQYQSVYK
ncbi:MAG: putative lipid II flippase FtsW [Endomicrobium sp.]|jgi:cell division protein FtsW|nr:putative lipid II flippase FtsW [Endomicrobium sp.]